MKFTRSLALGIAAGLAFGAFGAANTASAEPVAPGFAAVGSDTLQDSMNALTNGSAISGVNVRVTANGIAVGNFDAFGSQAIQTKPAGAYFGRPSGSGAGVSALRASMTGNGYSGNTAIPNKVITGQVDIARSSSGPGANANANGVLVYVPYARDAVSYAYRTSNPDHAAVLKSLTAAQLTTIYSAATPTTIDGVTIKPRLPQSNSGTRSFFLGAISVSTVGAAVPAGDNTANGPAENDATVLNQDEIIPFSVASWIAQANGAASVNTIANAAGAGLGSPLAQAAFTGSGSSLLPNSTYYSNTTWGRDTYLVVEYARILPSSPSYNAALARLVDSTAGVNSLVAWAPPATQPANHPGAVKAKFGFEKPSTTTPVRAFASA